jgi:hypothetical protein
VAAAANLMPLWPSILPGRGPKVERYTSAHYPAPRADDAFYVGEDSVEQMVVAVPVATSALMFITWLKQPALKITKVVVGALRVYVTVRCRIRVSVHIGVWLRHAPSPVRPAIVTVNLN